MYGLVTPDIRANISVVYKSEDFEVKKGLVKEYLDNLFNCRFCKLDELTDIQLATSVEKDNAVDVDDFRVRSMKDPCFCKWCGHQFHVYCNTRFATLTHDGLTAPFQNEKEISRNQRRKIFDEAVKVMENEKSWLLNFCSATCMNSYATDNFKVLTPFLKRKLPFTDLSEEVLDHIILSNDHYKPIFQAGVSSGKKRKIAKDEEGENDFGSSSD